MLGTIITLLVLLVLVALVGIWATLVRSPLTEKVTLTWHRATRLLVGRDHGARYICTPVLGPHRFVLPVAGLALAVLGWTVTTDMQVFNSNFLPPPTAVWGAAFQRCAPGPEAAQCRAGIFFDAPPQIRQQDGGVFEPKTSWERFVNTSAIRHGGFSLWRIAQAVFWACLIGIPIGIMMGAFGWFESLLQALVMPFRNAPILAFIPLFMLIWGVEEKMKVGFLAFGTVVYIIPAVFDAVRNVPSAVIDKAVDLGFRPLGTLWHFALPAALPRIYDGVRLCTGIAWTYLVAAEVINVTTGLGYVIQNAKRFQNTPKVYAGILLILLLGVLTDALFRAIRKAVPMLQQEQMT